MPARLKKKDDAALRLVCRFAKHAGAARPVKPGDYITLYLAGLGQKKTYLLGVAPDGNPLMETIQVSGPMRSRHSGPF